MKHLDEARKDKKRVRVMEGIWKATLKVQGYN